MLLTQIPRYCSFCNGQADLLFEIEVKGGTEIVVFCLGHLKAAIDRATIDQKTGVYRSVIVQAMILREERMFRSIVL